MWETKGRARQFLLYLSMLSMKNKAAVSLGRLGGKVKSEAKTKAVRENGKKGGRPKQCVCLQNQWGLHDRMNCGCELHCDPKNPISEAEIELK